MVIKKARDFISFKFGDIQVRGIMKFLGGATSLERCCKWDKKKFFPYELFDSANKLENEELPPYEAFFSKLRNNNPLDRDFKDYQKLRSSGLDEQKVLKSQYPHLDGKITNINTRFGRNMEWLHSKTFCSDTTTKMLFQPLKHCKKGSILSSERKWYVKTWMYSSKSSKYLSAQIK